MFSRSGDLGSKYYYEAIQINVNTTGTYRFTSQSNGSESYMDTTRTYPSNNQSYNSQGNIDTFSLIYQHSFNPSKPVMNLLQNDDDSAGNGQFSLTVYLQPDTTYVLVFTTYREGTIGSFVIVASGPNNVTFNSITNRANMLITLHSYMRANHKNALVQNDEGKFFSL